MADLKEKTRVGRYTVTESGDVSKAMELHNRVRGKTASWDRFRWLYSQNPFGSARVWFLHAPEGEAVGFTAAYPREFWVQGRVCLGLNCGDFSVEEGHRSLGPAVMLRRPARDLVDSGRFAFLYAHPLPAMLAVHRRAGHPQLGVMTRWVYPLKSAPILRRVSGRAVSAAASPLFDAALRVRAVVNRLGTNLFRVRRVDEFGMEYDLLDRTLGQLHSVIGRRTRAYLTWRYSRRPRAEPIILEARGASGYLAGYAVLELEGSRCRIQDLGCIGDARAVRALLAEAIRLALEQGAKSVSFVAERSFPAARVLRRCGFLHRPEEHPVVCYGGKGFWGKPRVEAATNWFMTVGDRDI